MDESENVQQPNPSTIEDILLRICLNYNHDKAKQFTETSESGCLWVGRRGNRETMLGKLTKNRHKGPSGDDGNLLYLVWCSNFMGVYFTVHTVVKIIKLNTDYLGTFHMELVSQ